MKDTNLPFDSNRLNNPNIYCEYCDDHIPIGDYCIQMDITFPETKDSVTLIVFLCSPECHKSFKEEEM